MKIYKFFSLFILTGIIFNGCRFKNKNNDINQSLTSNNPVLPSNQFKAIEKKPSEVLDPEIELLIKTDTEISDNLFRLNDLLNAYNDLKYIIEKKLSLKITDDPFDANWYLIDSLNKTVVGKAYLGELKNRALVVQKNSSDNYWGIQDRLFQKDIVNGKFKEVANAALEELQTNAAPLSKNLLSKKMAIGNQDAAQIKPGIVVPYDSKYDVIDESFVLFGRTPAIGDPHYVYNEKVFLSIPYPLAELEKKVSSPVSRWSVDGIDPIYDDYEVTRLWVRMSNVNVKVNFIISVTKNQKIKSKVRTFFPRKLLYDKAASMANMGQPLSPYVQRQRRSGAYSWKN